MELLSLRRFNNQDNFEEGYINSHRDIQQNLTKLIFRPNIYRTHL